VHGLGVSGLASECEFGNVGGLARATNEIAIPKVHKP